MTWRRSQSVSKRPSRKTIWPTVSRPLLTLADFSLRREFRSFSHQEVMRSTLMPKLCFLTFHSPNTQPGRFHLSFTSKVEFVPSRSDRSCLASSLTALNNPPRWNSSDSRFRVAYTLNLTSTTLLKSSLQSTKAKIGFEVFVLLNRHQFFDTLRRAWNPLLGR